MKQTIAFRQYSLNAHLFIELPEEIFKEIVRHAEIFYPNECGGILVGKVIGNTAFVEEMILPQRTTSSPIVFKRIANFFNNALQKLFNTSKGKSYYLGDWHSHPNAPPIPSRKDFNAMKEIAGNSKIRTETPLLLILGYAKEKNNEVFYLYSDDKLLAYDSI